MNKDNIEQILNSNKLSDETKAILLEKIAENIKQEKEKQQTKLSSWEQKIEDNKERIKQENPEFIKKQEEKAKATRDRIAQHNLDERTKELVGILSHLQSPNHPGYYIYKKNELEKMNSWDLEEIHQMYEQNDPTTLEKAIEEYKNSKNEIEAETIVEKEEQNKEKNNSETDSEKSDAIENDESQQEETKKQGEMTPEELERKANISTEQEIKKPSRISQAGSKLKSIMDKKATKAILAVAGSIAAIGLLIANFPAAVALLASGYVVKEFNKGRKS